MISITVDLIAGNDKIKGKQIVFYRGSAPGTVLFHVPLKYKKDHKIINIDWEEKATRSAGKAAAGAVIGGALTGGIGLVAGAALGGKKKDASIAVITYLDEAGKDQRLYIRCDAKKFEGLVGFTS